MVPRLPRPEWSPPREDIEGIDGGRLIEAEDEDIGPERVLGLNFFSMMCGEKLNTEACSVLVH